MVATEAAHFKSRQRAACVPASAACFGAGLALFLVVLPGPLAAETGKPLAARAILYEEDASSNGNSFVGSVVWRATPVKAPAGQSGDVAIRAEVEIPERRMKLTLVLRRNFDAALPANHFVELNFGLPPDFPGFGIDQVPGLLMKPDDTARGTPLTGLSTKTADTSFRIALSNIEEYRAKNLALLRDNAWISIPIVYSTRARAILAIEKGAGSAIFEDALAAWNHNP